MRCPGSAVPLALIALFAAACADEAKGGDEAGEARTEIVDPGTGPENGEPLWPLVIGERRVQATGVVAVPDKTEKFGATLYRFQGATTVRYYEKTDEGIFSAGSINLGALPRKVLLVPPKVKVGMTWRSYETGDLPSITSTVKSAQMAETIFGTRMVWTIDQRDEVGQVTYTTRFAEGRGPIELDGDPATSSIVPLDAEPVVATQARLPLTPLGGGLPVFESFWAKNASATIDASGKATVRVGGIMTWYRNSNGAGSWQLAPQTGCAVTSDGSTVTPGMTWAGTGDGARETDPSCPDAAAALYHDGTLQQIDVHADGSLADEHTGLHLLANGTTESFRVRTDQAGITSWALGASETGFGTDVRVQGGEIARAWAAAGSLQRILVDTTQPSDDFAFAALFGDRIVGGAVRGSRIAPLSLHAAAPGGQLSTVTTRDGRAHYLVTADGTVDRMRIADDGQVTLERYCELELPAQHEAVAVVPFPDRLLVLALRGRASNPVAGIQKPVLGDVLAFSAPLPSAAPDVARAMLPHNAITAEVVGADLKVCWPERAGPAITTGWTLGGKPVPAIASGANGACVVLVRAKDASAAGAGAYAAEGPIPGVGKVAIGVNPTSLLSPPAIGRAEWLTSLPAGGYTSVALRYGAAGDVIGVPDSPSPVDALSPVGRWVDPSGKGIWWPNGPFTRGYCGDDEPAAVLTGDVSRCIKAPFPGGISGFVAGGGIIWIGAMGVQLFLPDGTTLPVTGAPVNAVIAAALPDGTVCGVYSTGVSPAQTYSLYCAKDGVQRTAVIPLEQYARLQSPWFGSGGGFYVMVDATLLLYVNPVAPSVQVVDNSALGASPNGYVQPRRSSDGRLYVAHHVDSGEVHLYAVDGMKLTAADPDGYAPYAATTKDFVITERAVLAFVGDPPGDVLRFPRP